MFNYRVALEQSTLACREEALMRAGAAIQSKLKKPDCVIHYLFLFWWLQFSVKNWKKKNTMIDVIH
jgi:hypothetical protein